jgi:hypothetical protein
MNINDIVYTIMSHLNFIERLPFMLVCQNYCQVISHLNQKCIEDDLFNYYQIKTLFSSYHITVSFVDHFYEKLSPYKKHQSNRFILNGYNYIIDKNGYILVICKNNVEPAVINLHQQLVKLNLLKNDDITYQLIIKNCCMKTILDKNKMIQLKALYPPMLQKTSFKNCCKIYVPYDNVMGIQYKLFNNGTIQFSIYNFDSFFITFKKLIHSLKC